MDDLRPQVRQLGIDPAREIGGRPRQREDCVGAAAVGRREAGRDVGRQARLGQRRRQGAAARQRAIGGGAGPSGALEAGGVQRLDDAVDGLLAHPPQRRQLAARDHQQTVGGARDLVLARGLRRRVRAGREQRPQRRVGRQHVVGRRGAGWGRRGSRPRAGRRRRRRAPGSRRRGAAAAVGRPVGVGRADDGARAGGQARRTDGCRAASAAPARGPGAGRARRRTPGGRPASGAGGAPPSATKLSVNGPVALSTTRARASKRAPVSASTSAAPTTRPRRSRSSASRAQVVGDGGAGRLGVEDVLEHQSRVVGLAVDVGHRAGQARGAQVRARARRARRVGSLRPRAGGRHSASAL